MPKRKDARTGRGNRLTQSSRSPPGSAVFVSAFRPFRADAVAATPTAWYFADPRELWTEVEAVGLRVIRLQTEQDPADVHPYVTVVATKAGAVASLP